jgi:Carbamoylphosphate synthase large subunit (split gene in MJ)
LKEIYTKKSIKSQLKNPGPLRILFVAEAFRLGFTVEEVCKITFIDPWFLYHIRELVMLEKNICSVNLNKITKTQMVHWKQKGFPDLRIAELLHVEEALIRTKRIAFNIKPIYKGIDSCAAEFLAITPYLYSSYDYECEASPSDSNKKVIVLGGGPNRIGQGIEFDYCCVKALQALKTAGFEAIMINCNPETVSTDYDIADRLYFEPLTLESVLDIVELEKPFGVILQFGGQTPLKLARSLHKAKVRILGTSFDTIDLTEDRRKFSTVIKQLQIKQPRNSFAYSIEEGKEVAKNIGFPLIVRPSYVLGGNSMRVIYNEKELVEALFSIKKISDGPILLDEYLENAIEVDVDGVCDKEGCFIIAGVMEHIEPAGIHSGDSSCALPTVTLSKKQLGSSRIIHLKLLNT